MLRLHDAIVLSVQLLATAAEAQPYGCWALRDTVERLACFDTALGPPALDRRPGWQPADHDAGPSAATPNPTRSALDGTHD